MKRFFTLILGVALIASMHSCETIEENNGQIVEKKLKITAVIDGKMETRVSYDVDNEANTITPAWELNDEVFGFDSNDNTFTLKVTALLENGATLEPVGSYSPTEGTAVYAIFAPGYSVSNLSNRTLAVNLAEQGGVLNASTPALMCATGSVNADNELNLSFSNQTAIIGVKKFQLNGATAAGSVTSMTINGVITSGTFQLNEGVLELVPGSETGSITASNATGWATDESGICTAGVYFAAMPTSEAPEITLNAVADGIKYVNVSAITASAMEPGKYYYMSKKLGAGYVARIGSVLYQTIDAAWAVANASSSDVTVTLLDNCTASSQLLLKASSDGGGTGRVTIDLGNNALTTMNSTSTVSGIFIKPNREFAITGGSDGKIYNASSTAAAITNEGTCTVSGGTVESAGYRAISNKGGILSIQNNAIIISEGTYGIYNYNSGTVSITGGSITSASQCVYNSGGTLTISDGHFRSESAAAVTGNTSTGSTIISGGYFSRGNDGELFTSNSSAKVYVKGGYHDRAINSNRSRTEPVDGFYSNRGNTLNTDEATKDKYPFKVGNYTRNWNVKTISGSNNYTYWFSTLPGAAKEANALPNDVTIEPRQDLPNTGAATLGNERGHTITLDLKGYSITTSNNDFITATNTLIITDSSVDEVTESNYDSIGIIESSSYRVISVTAAKPGPIQIEKVLVKSSYNPSSTSNTDSKNYVIALYSGSDSGYGSLSIEKGARIDAFSSQKNNLRGVYCGYGDLTIDNAQVACYNRTAVYAYNNANLTIKGASTSIHNAGSGTENAIRIGGDSGPRDVQIEGGYVYAVNASVAIGAANTTAAKKITITGGCSNKSYTDSPSLTGNANCPTADDPEAKLSADSFDTLTGDDIIQYKPFNSTSSLQYPYIIKGYTLD